MEAFVLSFILIFLAEMGDKSQLMALAFATRYRALTVLAAITVATCWSMRGRSWWAPPLPWRCRPT